MWLANEAIRLAFRIDCVDYSSLICHFLEKIERKNECAPTTAAHKKQFAVTVLIPCLPLVQISITDLV